LVVLGSELKWRETGEPAVVDDLFFDAMGGGKYPDLAAFKKKLNSKTSSTKSNRQTWLRYD